MTGPTAVDLFCGAGGAARGLHQAGFDVRAGVDDDGFALQAYNESLSGEPVKHDLSVVDPSVLPVDTPDHVHGSPPCQGFSHAAGERNADDERNQLVSEFLGWIGALRPRTVTMENVAGMQSIEEGFMQRLEESFRNRGYRMRWSLLNAANYGVPQTRKRLFCIAFREDVPKPAFGQWFPMPTHAKHEWVGAAEVIDDLALAADGGVALTDQINETHQENGRRPLQKPDDPVNTIRAGTPPAIVNHDEADHSEKAKDRIRSWSQGFCGDSVTRRRLAAEDPAPTLTSSAAHPPAHYEQVRRLTVRECARLQSFPDDHYFVGPKYAQFRQVGNAVPPKLMYHLATHIKTELKKECGQS